MATIPDRPPPSAEAPWRRPPLPVLVLLPVALLFLGGAVGWALRAPDRPGRASVEVGFAYDMTSHHEQAVEMAVAELQNGVEPLARHFAQEVVISQRYEIGVMAAWLQGWGYDPADRPDAAMAWMSHSGNHGGHGMAGMDGPVTPETMPGMAGPAEMAALRESTGRDADARFLRLMKAHHEGGLAMAEDAAARAGDPQVRALAGRIARTQRTEVNEMTAAQRRLGL